MSKQTIDQARRILNIRSNDPSSVASLVPLMKKVSDRYDIGSSSSEVLASLDTLLSMRGGVDANTRNDYNLAVASAITTASEEASSLDTSSRDAYIASRINEYQQAILATSSDSTLAKEMLDDQQSRLAMLSTITSSKSSHYSMSSTLKLSQKLDNLLTNNLVQEIGTGSKKWLEGKFSTTDFLKNIANDLPLNLGSVLNPFLRAYDYSSLDVPVSASNPNLPRIKVDQVVCVLKDLASPRTPAYTLVHQPEGFTDSVSHSFSSTEIAGRTSPILGYNSSSRTVSFEFKVLEDYQAFDIEEVANFLRGMTYPDYDLSINRITPPKLLVKVGQFQEVLVVTDFSISYDANPVRGGKYIAATISMSGTIVPGNDGKVEYKSSLYKGNAYAEGRTPLARGGEGQGSLGAFTNQANLMIKNLIDELLAPIDSYINSVGTKVTARINEYITSMARSSNMWVQVAGGLSGALLGSLGIKGLGNLVNPENLISHVGSEIHSGLGINGIANSIFGSSSTSSSNKSWLGATLGSSSTKSSSSSNLTQGLTGLVHSRSGLLKK